MIVAMNRQINARRCGDACLDRTMRSFHLDSVCQATARHSYHWHRFFNTVWFAKLSSTTLHNPMIFADGDELIRVNRGKISPKCPMARKPRLLNQSILDISHPVPEHHC